MDFWRDVEGEHVVAAGQLPQMLHNAGTQHSVGDTPYSDIHDTSRTSAEAHTIRLLQEEAQRKGSWE